MQLCLCVWDRGLDAVGFEREVEGLACVALAVLVLAVVLGRTGLKGLDFWGPLVCVRVAF